LNMDVYSCRRAPSTMRTDRLALAVLSNLGKGVTFERG
jgi:hypothetical protein